MKRVAGLTLLFVVLSGCASTPLDRYLASPLGVPPSAHVEGVPFLAQKRNHCGPASVAMVSAWAGKPVSPDALADRMITPDRAGTFQADLLSAVRREGLMGVETAGLDSLFKEVAAGHPVVVFENLGLSWYPFWHYAVVIGYDLPERKVILHTDQDAALPVSLARFERDWEGGQYWSAVVLPPDQLAVSADEVDHLQAASGLERVGKSAEALVAYRTILKRWPKSLGAWVGIGNLRFAAGDPRGAITALRTAAEFHPRVAHVWHNLALAYAGAHLNTPARRSAMKAMNYVSLADTPQYRESLRAQLDLRPSVD